jgi:hypothetical protein
MCRIIQMLQKEPFLILLHVFLMQFRSSYLTANDFDEDNDIYVGASGKALRAVKRRLKRL